MKRVGRDGNDSLTSLEPSWKRDVVVNGKEGGWKEVDGRQNGSMESSGGCLGRSDVRIFG